MSSAAAADDDLSQLKATWSTGSFSFKGGSSRDPYPRQRAHENASLYGRFWDDSPEVEQSPYSSFSAWPRPGSGALSLSLPPHLAALDPSRRALDPTIGIYLSIAILAVGIGWDRESLIHPISRLF